MKRGYIELYTGDGKGKTTAAAGLALRVLGNGMRVLFVQFLKSEKSGEIEMLKKCGLKNFHLLREWDGSFILTSATPKQKELCENLWTKSLQKVDSFKPDLLVLDEVTVAITFSLLSEDDLLEFLENKPSYLEVVMTGQGASEALIKKSDLVTIMEKRKHYYDKGVVARKGIEY